MSKLSQVLALAVLSVAGYLPAFGEIKESENPFEEQILRVRRKRRTKAAPKKARKMHRRQYLSGKSYAR